MAVQDEFPWKRISNPVFRPWKSSLKIQERGMARVKL